LTHAKDYRKIGCVTYQGSYNVSKAKDSKKDLKKKPAKSLKEKRAAKKEKRDKR